ncbi:PaaX family transcriptional regulator C-terminal domain-containing protein [Streptomyces sp. Li-HN-5-11]|uniref:PaaX family transcriptional regulator n=1 Tax=Streptomyces sp. Li-HN-5-11 TaxID=3075432 RepID=UPI0028ADE783|nr:PaaX family transcriptional regulator C-terminal domain-containing protein [Streptomyces sp. Li-HN-5-11]WNM31921.1 PaaX family transcriptional regulator C-terminal domain-containing protein [Streptomyces sp. Li-HN-5-11]
MPEQTVASLSNFEEPCSGDDGESVPLTHRAGTSQRGLAEILIADYTFPDRAWLPSGAIVALLGEFGVASGAARTTISRLARRGVLENCRQGRYSWYRLTQRHAGYLWSGGGSIAAFTTNSDSWDGWWTLIAFSVPEDESARRRALRTALRSWGYAPLYDAVWVSPRVLTPDVRSGLADFGMRSVSVFRAQHEQLELENDRNPVQAWDLAGIADQYNAFIRRWSSLLPAIAAGRVTGAAAVRARTEVVNTYRHFPAMDPLLPLEFLPPGWPRARAREVCVAVYDGLAQSAQDFVRAVVAQFSDTPHPGTRAHTIASMSAGMSHGHA